MTVPFAPLLLMSVMARAAIVKITWLFCRFRERRREEMMKSKHNFSEYFLEENLPGQSGLTFSWATIPSFVWKKKGILNSELPTRKLTFGRTYL